MRSAALGHHFAGHTNKFWRLMSDAGFLPAGAGYLDDGALPLHGFGITNLVARPTAGIADLGPDDYARGRRALVAKIRRWRPELVALVGVMVFRELFGERGPVTCGLQERTIDRIPVWVLPNPSGRNAHFSYAEMLRYFAALRRSLVQEERRCC